MALRLVQVNVKTRDDAALGRFWADALGWGTSSEGPGVTNVEPVGFVWPDPAAVCVDVVSVPDPRDGEVPLAPRSRHHGVGRGRSLNRAESLGAGSTPRRGTDARDPAWGGRPGRHRKAIGEGWRSGWAYVRSLPDRLTSTASVCRQLVVRCWKRSSRSSVPALPVSVASKLRVATAKVGHTRPSTSGHVSSSVQLVHQHLGSSVALRWRRERAPILRGHLVG
jgi:hypothetical protein